MKYRSRESGVAKRARYAQRRMDMTDQTITGLMYGGFAIIMAIAAWCFFLTIPFAGFLSIGAAAAASILGLLKWLKKPSPPV